MTVNIERGEWRLTVPAAEPGDSRQNDPDLSLGGRRSLTLAYDQSQLTADMTSAHVVVDSGLVQPPQASVPNANTPIIDSGDYREAESLVHWWRFGVFAAPSIGFDYTTQSGGFDLEPHPNVTLADLVDLQPGQFNQARRSLFFAGTDTAIGTRLTGQATLGIENEWSVGIWFRPTDLSGTGTMVRLGQPSPASGTNLANAIQIHRNGPDLLVRIIDGTTVTSQKERQFDGVLALNTWTFVLVTWDGTSLNTYQDGVLLVPSSVPEDDDVVMLAAASRHVAVGAINSNNFPFDEFRGQIHSVLVWNVELPNAAAAAVSIFGDGPVLSDGNQTGRWLVFVTGLLALEAERIAFHDTSTGSLFFSDGFSSAGGLIGDTFRISGSDNLFGGPNSVECANGVTEYRGLAFHSNDVGETLNDIRVWARPLNKGAHDFELAVGDIQKRILDAFPGISSDVETPDLDQTGQAAGFGARVQRFRPSRSFPLSRELPQAGLTRFNLPNNLWMPVWLRRITPPLTQRNEGSAWLLVAEAESGNLTPGPHRSPMVIVSDPEGFTPDLRLTFDRTPRTFGGARMVAILRDLTTQTAIEQAPIDFTMIAGPGQLTGQVSQQETDTSGQAAVQYVSPEDDSQAGATVTVEARLGGDS